MILEETNAVFEDRHFNYWLKWDYGETSLDTAEDEEIAAWVSTVKMDCYIMTFNGFFKSKEDATIFILRWA